MRRVGLSDLVIVLLQYICKNGEEGFVEALIENKDRNNNQQALINLDGPTQWQCKIR